MKIESIKNEKRKHRTEGDVRMTKKSCLNYKTNFPLLSYRTEQSETLMSPPPHIRQAPPVWLRLVRSATIHGQTMMNVLTDG